MIMNKPNETAASVHHLRFSSANSRALPVVPAPASFWSVCITGLLSKLVSLTRDERAPHEGTDRNASSRKHRETVEAEAADEGKPRVGCFRLDDGDRAVQLDER
jgi:hypothetical protein